MGRIALNDLINEKWNPKPGDEFYYGKYGKLFEDPDWIVLDCKGDSVLAMTEEVIQWLPYDENNHGEWLNSSLRKWLNEEYCKSIFNENDPRIIKNEDNDYISLMDYDTAGKYYEILSAKRASAISDIMFDETIEWGEYDTVNLPYWLKSVDDDHICYVDEYGDNEERYLKDPDDDNGMRFNLPLGVRPIVWFKIK